MLQNRYNYYIINSYSNFEEKKINFKNFCKNYEKITLSGLPYLVALKNKKVVGIAYLNNFREKSINDFVGCLLRLK